jgi:hypothetical protein
MRIVPANSSITFKTLQQEQGPAVTAGASFHLLQPRHMKTFRLICIGVNFDGSITCIYLEGHLGRAA